MPGVNCGDPQLLLTPGSAVQLVTSIEASALTFSVMTLPGKSPAVRAVDAAGHFVSSGKFVCARACLLHAEITPDVLHCIGRRPR